MHQGTTSQFLYSSWKAGFSNKGTKRQTEKQKTSSKINSTLKVSPWGRRLWLEGLPSLYRQSWFFRKSSPHVTSPSHVYSANLASALPITPELLSLLGPLWSLLQHPGPLFPLQGLRVCYMIPLWARWPLIHSHVSFTAHKHPTSNPSSRWSIRLKGLTFLVLSGKPTEMMTCHWWLVSDKL